MKKIFIDTNIIMQYGEVVFKNNDKILIHITVLEELDHINHTSESPNKKYCARKALHIIEKYLNSEMLEIIIDEPKYKLPSTLDFQKNDHRILAMAKDLYDKDNEVLFITDDLNLLLKAQSINLPCEKFTELGDDNLYIGYKEVIMDDYEMSVHYECPVNKWGLFENEYLIIKNADGKIVDKQRWTNNGFAQVASRGFKSVYLGNIKPKDTYQMLAIDSLNNTDFTVLYGHAGTAKTLLSLCWVMQNIESGKIGKCVIIFNPAKLKNNDSLGYYTGNRTEKLLQNSIGGILSSKFGDMIAVETLINQGKLLIIPTSDIRGIEISDNDCLFVTEAQNTDSYTMRTILQRAKEGCKVIVEGDILEQQDLRHISSKENGMIKILEVFKGSNRFSCVRLKNVYRSEIAELAQNI